MMKKKGASNCHQNPQPVVYQTEAEERYAALQSKIKFILNDPNISLDEKELLQKKIQIVEKKKLCLDKARTNLKHITKNVYPKTSSRINPQNEEEKQQNETEIIYEQDPTIIAPFENISPNYLPNQSTFSLNESDRIDTTQFINLQSNFDTLVDEVMSLKKQISMVTSTNHSIQSKLESSEKEKKILNLRNKELIEQVELLQKENDELLAKLQKNDERSQQDPKQELLKVQISAIRKLLSKISLDDVSDYSDDSF